MDSGADACYMSFECSKQLDLEINSTKIHFVRGFNGYASVSPGTVTTEIELSESHKITATFTLVENTPCSVILGKSFLNGRAVVNFIEGSAEFFSIESSGENNNNQKQLEQAGNREVIELKNHQKEDSHSKTTKVVEEIKKNAEIKTEDKDGLPEDIFIEFKELFDEKQKQKFIPDTFMQIPTINNVPIREKMRPLNREGMNEVRSQTETLLNRGVIEASNSPWSFPVVLVRKKNGSQRMCVDYRKLNTRTTRDNFPLPRIEQILAIQNGKKIFSTIDCKDGFYHLRIRKEDRPKTAFVTPFGLFQYIGSPFGLRNTPANFQRAMNSILQPVSSVCQPFVDDILISSPSYEEHVRDVKQVLQCLQSSNLTLNRGKCCWFQQAVDVLGHRINQNGIEPQLVKIESITSFKQPTNAKDIQKFLGIVTYVSRFFPGLAEYTKSLRLLTRKEKQFEWSTVHESDFKRIKQMASFPSRLSFHDDTLSKVIHIESSGLSIGCTLFQDRCGKLEMLDSRSRLLSETEQRYSEVEREGLALELACLKFSVFLHGGKVKVATKKPVFKSIFKKDKLPVRLAKILLASQDLDLDVDCTSSQVELALESSEEESTTATEDELSFLIPTVYVDGACLKNGQEEAKSSFGIWWGPEHKLNRSEVIESNCTNQRAELSAAITAIKQGIEQGLPRLRVVSDSIYVVQSQREWMDSWKANGFCNSKGKTISNKDLHVELAELGEKISILWCHVRGHSGVVGNENADRLAKAALGIEIAEINAMEMDDRIKYEQANDEWTSRIILEIQSGKSKESFKVKDGVLIKISNGNEKLVVPKLLRQEILRTFHDAPFGGGHQGHFRTVKNIEEHFWWKGLREHVIKYINSCHQCQIFKPVPGKPTGNLRPVTVDGFMDTIAIDFVGPLPTSQRGNRFIVVCVEYFSKLAIVKPLQSIDAQTTAEFIVNEVICHHGLPRKILTDQGSAFKSKLITDLLSLLQVKQVQSAPYHPACNGLVERLNGTLLRSLKRYASDNIRSWDSYLPLVVFTYNTSVQSSTGYTPYEITHGRKARVINLGHSTNSDINSSTVADLRKRLAKIEEEVKIRDEQSKIRQKDAFDSKHVDRRINENDLVLIKRQYLNAGEVPKFAPKFSGPFKVEQVLNSGRNVKININGRSKVQSYSNVKIYHQRDGSLVNQVVETTTSATLQSRPCPTETTYDEILQFAENFSSYCQAGRQSHQDLESDQVDDDQSETTEIYQLEDSASASDPLESRDTFTCTVCSRSFGSDYNRRRHELVHADNFLFNCSLCGRGFNYADKCRRHEESVHRSSFTCIDCGWNYSSKACLTKHRENHN